MTYNLIVMAFDGEVQLERVGFKTVEEAWEHANNMGSRWYFYPFHFVTTASSKTIVEACGSLDELNGKRLKTVVDSCLSGMNGKRLKTVRALFKELSEQLGMENAGVEDFIYEIQFRS